MKKSLFAFGVLAFLIFGASFAEAQDKVAMYPYSVFNEKPLPVGATVWVNLGDTKCAYGNWSKDYYPHAAQYALPSASDECFAEYRKAKIVRILKMYGYYVYRVQYEPWMDTKDGFRYEYNGEFDSLYEVFNLPEKWAKYSKYFLALNW